MYNIIEIEKELNNLDRNKHALLSVGRLTQLYDASTVLQFEKGMIMSRLLLGIYYYNTGEVYSALNCYEEALAYADKLVFSDLKMRIYNEIGIASIQIEDYVKAIESIMTSIKMGEGLHKSPLSSYVNIGEIYRTIGEYDKALEYFKMALNSANLLGNMNHKMVIRSNMIEIELERNLYSQDILKELLEYSEFSASQDDLINYANINRLLGIYYCKNGEFDLSCRFFDKAIEKYIAVNDGIYIFDCYINYADSLMVDSRFEDSLLMIKKAYSLAKKNKNRIKLIDLVSQLATIYDKMGNVSESSKYYKEYHRLMKKKLKDDESARFANILSIETSKNKPFNASNVLDKFKDIKKSYKSRVRFINDFDEIMRIDKSENALYIGFIELDNLLRVTDKKEHEKIDILQNKINDLLIKAIDKIDGTLYRLDATKYVAVVSLKTDSGSKLMQRIRNKLEKINFDFVYEDISSTLVIYEFAEDRNVDIDFFIPNAENLLQRALFTEDNFILNTNEI